MVTLSVVVPHHGDPRVTASLLDQLRRQTLDAPVQLIVVDDASPTAFPATTGVDVVRRDRNGGFGSAVNSGAARVAGSHMLVLNSDLDVPDDFLESMLRAARRLPRTVLSPRVVDEAGELAWAGRIFPRVSHQAVEWLTPLARWRDSDLWHRGVGHDLSQRDGETEVDWVMGAAMLIPVAEFRAVGAFDERFYMNAEEVDLQRRLRAAHGVGSVVLAEPTVVHAGGGSSPSDRRRRWLVESRLRYADKWGGRWRLQLALRGASGTNLVFNTIRRAAGRPIAPMGTFRSELALLRGWRPPGTAPHDKVEP